MLGNKANCNMLILGEIQRLEELSSEYEPILTILVNNVVKKFAYYLPVK